MVLKILEFRMKLNLTQKEMAELLGVSLSYYSKIENSLRQPSFNFIKKFKKIIEAELNTHVDVGTIFFE